MQEIAIVLSVINFGLIGVVVLYKLINLKINFCLYFIDLLKKGIEKNEKN